MPCCLVAISQNFCLKVPLSHVWLGVLRRFEHDFVEMDGNKRCRIGLRKVRHRLDTGTNAWYCFGKAQLPAAGGTSQTYFSPRRSPSRSRALAFIALETRVFAGNLDSLPRTNYGPRIPLVGFMLRARRPTRIRWTYESVPKDPSGPCAS